MGRPKEMEMRPSVDRPIAPLGFQPRPLLSHAAAAIMNQPNSPESDKESESALPRREDSTEDLPVPASETNPSLVSRLIPSRAHPRKSSEIWDKVLQHLRQEDMSGAKKNLLRLLRHRSKSRSATFNRCRAVSLLSVLSIVNEWYSTGALSLTASRRLSEGVLLKSVDCIALGTWMFIMNRWTLPSALSAEDLGRDLESAAKSGHAASQAVLGLILCQHVEEDSTDSSGNRTNDDASEAYITDTPGSSSKASKRVTQRSRMLRPQPDILTGSKYLRDATSQGYFLAVNNIAQAVTKGQNYEKIQKKKVKETLEKNSMWPAELAVEPASSEEYFSWIQNAANQQVAECAFLMSKLLRKGIGCRKSDADSLRWVVMASDMGVPESFVALRSRAVNSNWKLMDVLAMDDGDDERRRKSELSILQSARDEVIQNKDVVRLCDEKVSKWKKHSSRNEKIMSLYRLCNLQTKFPDNMSEGLVRLIFERDRAGWSLEVT